MPVPFTHRGMPAPETALAAPLEDIRVGVRSLLDRDCFDFDAGAHRQTPYLVADAGGHVFCIETVSYTHLTLPTKA